MRAEASFAGVCVACACLCFAAVARAEVRYRVLSNEQLPLPQFINHINGISDSGYMVGTSTDLDMESFGFLIRPDGTVVLIAGDGESWYWSYATGVNEQGHFVGHYELLDSSEGFLWTPSGGLTLLGALPNGHDIAFPAAVNALDEVCGTDSVGNLARAFRWTAGDGIESLGLLPGATRSGAEDINDLGRIVGGSGIGLSDSRAFVWDVTSGMVEMPGGFDITPERAYAINNAGQIVGSALTPGGRKAFLWDEEDGMVILPNLPDLPTYAIAYDINEHGVVVGTAAREIGFHRYIVKPFIWDSQHGTRTLETLLDPCALRGALYLRDATVISNHGQIAVNSSELGGYLLTPYLPGDLDDSGGVELQDLATLLANFGRSGDATYASGDTDCDADVDLQDLATLLGNFGAALP